MHTANIIIA